MRRTTRRDWIKGAAAAVSAPALINPARAAEFNWRIGHTNPVAFPIHQRLTEAAKEINQKSNGRIEVSVIAEGQLGSPMGLLNQVRQGNLEGTAMLGQALASAQGAAALPLVGFAWPNYDALWKAIDGELGKMIRDLVRDRSGLLVMDTVWDFGFRQVTTASKEIKTAADLAGLRLRTPVEPDFVNLFQGLKANPIAMSLPDVYRGLSSGDLDGQEGLLGLVIAARFHSIQGYCALTNHIWDGNWICVNPGQFRRLPDDLKSVVANALNEAGKRHRKDAVDNDAKAIAAMTEAKVKINQVDPASFRAMLKESGYYRDMRRKLGTNNWDMLEKFTGKLV